MTPHQTEPHVVLTIGGDGLPETVHDGLTGELLVDHRGRPALNRSPAPTPVADAGDDEFWGDL